MVLNMGVYLGGDFRKQTKEVEWMGMGKEGKPIKGVLLT